MALDARVVINENRELLIADLAQEIACMANECVADRGRFTVALSGGSTPKPLYEQLASSPSLKSKMPWNKSYFFLGDERCVSHNSDESNFKMIDEAMFKKVPVKEDNIFATEKQDVAPEEAANQYEDRIKKFFSLSQDQFPVFDLILLGLGDDGHTASLFPGSSGLNETKRICIANYVKKFGTHRITFTFPTINNARRVIFLVSGKTKSGIIADIVSKKQSSYPAELVRPTSGTVEWYLDRDAASQLDPALCK